MLKIKRLGTGLSPLANCAQDAAADLWRIELGYLDNVNGNNGNASALCKNDPLALA